MSDNQQPSPQTNQASNAGMMLALSPEREAELIRVLQASVYPGASEDSVRLVIGYCRFHQLDPLGKPVHIVPMSIEIDIPNPSYREGSAAPKTVKQMVRRDVLMPGVGLYRIRADRSGTYMGMAAPEYGPTIEQVYGTFTVRYPEWCKIVVKKLVNDKIVEFEAVEYWLENYATAGNDTTTPNKMWRKRPFGQLSKCTEAQGLRKAWPDLVGAAPTAEEMEGHVISSDDVRELRAAADVGTILDKTKERTAQLRADMEASIGGDGKIIDVDHNGEVVHEDSETTATDSKVAATDPEATDASAARTDAGSGSGPDGEGACRKWVYDPKSKFCKACGYLYDEHVKKGTPASSDKAQTTTAAAAAPTLPLAGEAVVLDGLIFPANLKATGVKDRIRLDQYEALTAEASRLKVDLRAQTEEFLGIVPDDLSKEAASLFLQWLQSQKAPK